MFDDTGRLCPDPYIVAGGSGEHGRHVLRIDERSFLAADISELDDEVSVVWLSYP